MEEARYAQVCQAEWFLSLFASPAVDKSYTITNQTIPSTAASRQQPTNSAHFGASPWDLSHRKLCSPQRARAREGLQRGGRTIHAAAGDRQLHLTRDPVDRTAPAPSIALKNIAHKTTAPKSLVDLMCKGESLFKGLNVRARALFVSVKLAWFPAGWVKLPPEARLSLDFLG